MIEGLTTIIHRIALPVVKNSGLDSRINPHFGKSKGFVLVDSDGSNCEYLEAEAIRLPSECAPISGLAKRGTRVLLCRGMGRGALARCHAAGFLIGQADGTTVREVIENHRNGLSVDFPDSAICSHSHSCHESDH